MIERKRTANSCCNPGAGGKKIPINVIGGFLGAGKTTFLNYILDHNPDERTDVLIREYGKEAVDDKLLHEFDGKVYVFSGISLHEDAQLLLHDRLKDLYQENGGYPEFDRLLLETSGIDRPDSLLQLFMVGHIPHMYRLGSFAVVVDAQYGMLDLEEYDVAVEQVACADVILLNKMDLATEEEMEALEEKISSINGMARIYRTSYCEIPLEYVKDLTVYQQLKDLTPGRTGEGMNGIYTITLSESRPMDKQKVNEWIDHLYRMEGPKFLRGKGFFSFAGEDWRYEFQSVRKSFHSKTDRLWYDDEERKSTVVLIGENLPDEKELRESFAACAADL